MNRTRPTISYIFDIIYDTNPGSFGTSSVPGGNEVTIDCGDPSASAGAGVSMMIIVFYF